MGNEQGQPLGAPGPQDPEKLRHSHTQLTTLLDRYSEAPDYERAFGAARSRLAPQRSANDGW